MKNFIICITVLMLTGCGSARVLLNADIPKDQDIKIEITTKQSEE
jgi:uncharacterized protein YceK